MWEPHTYEGEPLSLVFTTPTGGLVLRQTVAKVIKQAAKTAGITAELGTHAGRRTVVTTLFVDGDEALEDIARFVGHARPSTTAGYVKRLGRRPQSVAKRAAASSTLRPTTTTPSARGSESPRRFWEQRWELRPRIAGIGGERGRTISPGQTHKPGRWRTVRTCGAEGVGFEPTVGRTHTRFPSVPIRPLSHPSWGGTPDRKGYRVRCP